MAKRKTLRDELSELRAELAALRGSAGAKLDGAAAAVEGSVEAQLAELNALVKSTLEDAEDKISDHPVVAVAAALALGIVIGRLISR